MRRVVRKVIKEDYVVRSDINVTPLVDVCLVLLIIFMVVTPLLQEGVPVNLPETLHPERMPEGQNELEVAIQGNGTIYLGDAPVASNVLAARLAEIYRQTPQKDVVVKADRNLKYRQVREVMRTINEAGFRSVGLVTHRIGEEGAG